MKKEFKAESKELLELMIHSIYSNKDIFLRELISNASDALDKRAFLAIQDHKYENKNPEIKIEVNKKDRIIKIIDNGIGMNEQDLEDNLGTIAHSGSKEFLKHYAKDKNEPEIIGQFGVGFYSSFIVSDLVEVDTKKVGEDAFKWSSDGVSAYEISKSNIEHEGSILTLHIREGKEFDKFLDTYEIEHLIKRYSDFIKYPIKMEKEIKIYDKDENGNDILEKYTTKTELQTINSMKAIWKRNKSEVSQEDYDNFYMSQFHDWEKPLKTIKRSVEGNLNYDLLLFIPAKRPFDFYNPTYKKQIDLYSKSVFIESNCDYLLPDAFKFVKGIVDSEDISLNISREMLQHDNKVKKLASAIETKIKQELEKMLKNERDLYNQFYQEYEQQLVFGLYDNFGAKKDLLKDLVMFKTNKNHEYTTFKEYVERMPEKQTEILYVVGQSIEQIEKMPIMEQVDDELEVFYFLNEIDEFAIGMLNNYDGKPFKSLANADLTTDEKVKEDIAKKTDEKKDLLTKISASLGNDVSEVILSSRLKNSPVYLGTKDDISLEMAKTLAKMPGGQEVKANMVLELNPNHELFKSLERVYEKRPDAVDDYAKLLFNQALLLEGMPIKDPNEYASLMTKIMVEASKNE